MTATTPPALERIAVKTAELSPGFQVARALPTRQRRMVGAWCFLDHLGPVAFTGGQGMHVGAHPHTGLQTFTWMISGQILHRDSLGSEQVIRPGQVNLMTAGHGIAHTEDSLPGETGVHAAQLWIALPPGQEDVAPAFDHHPELPTWARDGASFTLLAGEAGGHQAPTRLYSPLLGLDIASPGGARTTLPLRPDFEYGVLPLEGHAQLGGERLGNDEFAWLGRGRDALDLLLEPGSRLLLLGGEPFAEPVTMWWNFVGPSRAYIAQAQAAWESASARFGAVKGQEGRRLTAPPLPWAR